MHTVACILCTLCLVVRGCGKYVVKMSRSTPKFTRSTVQPLGYDQDDDDEDGGEYDDDDDDADDGEDDDDDDQDDDNDDDDDDYDD